MIRGRPVTHVGSKLTSRVNRDLSAFFKRSSRRPGGDRFDHWGLTGIFLLALTAEPEAVGRKRTSRTLENLPSSS